MFGSQIRAMTKSVIIVQYSSTGDERKTKLDYTPPKVATGSDHIAVAWAEVQRVLRITCDFL